MDRKQVKARRQALIEAYKETWETTPKDTLERLTEEIGATESRMAVSELVRSVGDWDERIWDYVRAWADGVDGAASREEMEAAYIFQPSEIHPSHINQLGLEMVNAI